MHRGFEASADRRAIGIRLQIVQFGDREQRFEQVVNPLARSGAGLDNFHVAAPFGRQQTRSGQLLENPLNINARQIDFVQRDDDRHIGRPSVADGFLGLRHHAVVGGDDEHGDVGDIGAASPHLGEGFVARRIDERDLPARFFDLVGADVLRDAAAFAAGYVDADDFVQQRRLAVVDVTENVMTGGRGLSVSGGSACLSSTVSN